MDNIVGERFGDAIRRSLVILQPLEGKHPQARLVWTRTAEGGWKGEETVVSNPNRVMVAAAKPLAEIASEFSKLFLEQYPEYGAPVGLSGLWQGNIASDPGFILSMALWELWARHKIFSCGDNAIQSLVQEFTEFVDSKTVEIRGTVLLLNFSMDVDKIDVGNHVTIRKLGDEEISDIYGSPIESIGLAPSNRLGINEFVLEYDFELEESFGDQKPNVISNRELAWAEFDKVIMGLRVFKPGPVGYESIRFRTVKFFPASFGLIGRHGFLPFDRYHISRAETEPMAIWVKMIFAVSEQAIELACSRLSDAETRSEPRDRVLDAVIGLESLLLAGLPKEDRRGELRFRFSLNYSTLFEPKERYHAFTVAKDLYDLRSSIAHGGVPKGDTWRIGDEKLIPHQAARRAAEALRFVIQFFLPEASAAPYKNPQYWENRYFGQEESRVAESHCE